MAPALILGAEEGPICPICGASAEPDAAFCTQCGHRLEPTKTPPADRPGKPDASASVVQVVAAHDKEMTSAHRAIAYGTKVHVDSMLGTGFAIAPGRIVTDSGVLAGAREINLFSASHRKIPARVVGVDHLIGVALLATDAVDIPPLATRSGEPAQLGERLRVFGFPSTPGTASGLLATSGVISGLNRTEIGIHPIEDYQQTDATLASGFAGGPVVDAEGRLIGMSTSACRSPSRGSSARWSGSNPVNHPVHGSACWSTGRPRIVSPNIASRPRSAPWSTRSFPTALPGMPG
jgi:S1-C subfamily serine protease